MIESALSLFVVSSPFLGSHSSVVSGQEAKRDPPMRSILKNIPVRNNMCAALAETEICSHTTPPVLL